MIETALELPQASALVLARELSALGYLAYDPRVRTYFPTEALANLTKWMGDLDLPLRRLSAIADEIANVTEETTSVCTRNEYALQIEHFAHGTRAGSILMHLGRAAPLPCSYAGRAVLATLSDDEVAKVIALTKRRDPRATFDAKAVLQDVRSARRSGVIAGHDLMISGIGAVAFPIPVEVSGGAFALVIGAPSPRIRADRDKLIRMVRPIIKTHLGNSGRSPRAQKVLGLNY